MFWTVEELTSTSLLCCVSPCFKSSLCQNCLFLESSETIDLVIYLPVYHLTLLPPTEYKFNQGRGRVSFFHRCYFQYLEPCLTHSWCSVYIFSINKYMNKCLTMGSRQFML